MLGMVVVISGVEGVDGVGLGGGNVEGWEVILNCVWYCWIIECNGIVLMIMSKGIWRFMVGLEGLMISCLKKLKC